MNYYNPNMNMTRGNCGKNTCTKNACTNDNYVNNNCVNSGCSNNNCINGGYSNNNCREMKNYPIGMAYVPWQEWKNVMPAKEGICYGTIFSELVLPFYGYRNGGR